MQKNQLSCESAAPVKQKERRIVTWTPEEDDILREQISIHGSENWALIASKFKDKTTRQCRRRWYTYLNSDFKKGGWSPEEDMLLCEAQKVFGNRWTEIAKVVSGRTDNAVKNRFTTLCKKRAKNEALAKENNTTNINENNKRAISNSISELEGSSDIASPLKKLRSAHILSVPTSCKIVNKGCSPGKQHSRPPFAILAENICKLDTLLSQNQVNPPETLIDGSRKIEGTFLKKDDPKILALMEQAELLSSLAIEVNTDTTEQSMDNAWKVLDTFLNKGKDTEVLKCTVFEEDLQLDQKLKGLVEELRNGNGEIQPCQRQPDMYDSPNSSEYSNGSRMSTNASEQMEQSQSEMCTLHDNAGTELQTTVANAENTQSPSDNKNLARESANQEEISVPSVEAEIDEDLSALLIADFSSPLQLTPMFKSFAATVPSPQFSESERHFLMKTLGIESPAPSKSTNPSQPPLCRRALIHSL